MRRLAKTDLVAFQAYRLDAELGRYQGWTATSDAEAAAFLAAVASADLLQPGTWCQIGIALPDHSLIGDIGLCLSASGEQVEIGFTLQRAAHGRGLATRAVRLAMDLVFEHTQAAQVVGVTDARNGPSIRLLERAGLHRVAATEAVFRGEVCVEFTYAVGRPGGRDAGAA